MLTLLVTAAVLAAPPLPFDVAQPSLGRWMGGSGPAELVLDIEPPAADAADAVPGVTLTALQLGVMRGAGRSVTIGGATIAFDLPAPIEAGYFDGFVEDDGQSISGKLVIDEVPRAVTLHRTIRPRACAVPHVFEGIVSVGVDLRMRFALAEAPNGVWVGAMDVPAQGLHSYPLIDVVHADGAITATVPVPGSASLDARIEGDRLVGTFRQGGLSMPVAFDRVAADAGIGPAPRPQDPKPPLPYRTREIVAEHPGGFTLAGTLTIPDAAVHGPGPYPAAVLITGSGQQDRDESLMGHRPFLVIADRLTRAGIAVMRYDDRGVGASGGRDTLETATSFDFAEDARLVLERVGAEPEIDADRIGLIGHSEGGLIAPMVALQAPERVAFAVLLAGPGVPGRDVLAQQTRLLWLSSGAPAELVERWGGMFDATLDRILAGAERDEVIDGLMEIAREQTELTGEKQDEAALRSALGGQLEMLQSPWMRFFLEYDPAPALASIQCPVLALNGTRDLQVWHEQNLDAIERIAERSGADITVMRCAGLNHLFQPCRTGAVSEYAEIEITFDEGTLARIVAWIKGRG